MLDSELLETGESPFTTAGNGMTAGRLEGRPEAGEVAIAPPSELDAEKLFSAELGSTTVLTRAEEVVLTRAIAHARQRITRILKRARRLSRAALADGGRGVVHPEEDFRERETVMILTYASQALQTKRSTRATGLSRASLRTFVSTLSAALGEYRVLRDQMVRANARLVNLLARRYHHPTLTRLDLFQEGAIGLLRAIEKYDPDRNIKFSTYAMWWIWQQLGRAADTYGSLIRTPVHWNQLRRRLSRDEQELAGQSEGPVSRETLAGTRGIQLERLEAMAQTFHFVSTDAPVSDTDDRTLETVLAAEGDEAEETVLKATLRERLEAALTQLPERERYILRQRFGWEEDRSETLDEIGSRLGVSRERIRQLESRALHKLKEVCTSQGLEDYLH